ncbi:hypothetical protein AAT19DRAFT_13988 [Rhodotorula toruloides]|uniref:GRF-type domain-containing protein n=1 Tax=Rhodotorula toruloides TaxID=5286 RepID=A0A2T0AAH9_RHOTO|nr:hypothetical protein AAT19DRAFT_13988 [Rhodotorula toruloides]
MSTRTFTRGASRGRGRGAIRGGAGSGGAGFRKNDAQKYRDHGCFLSNGEVLCFCNTEPRIKAIRRVTRKESSPNLGREFWSCGNWVEGEGCGFFLWCDEAAAKGREYKTPPPAGAAPPLTPSSSPQKRPFPSPTPAKSSPAPPSTQEDTFDDIDFDSLDAEIEDEIEDADPPTPAPSTPASGSPAKKPRFESFAGSSQGPVTPTKPAGRHGGAGAGQTARPGGFDAIRADPDSPFHVLQRSLFGSDAAAPPASSPTTPSSSPTKGADSDSDSFAALSSALSSLPSLLDSAKKDREKDARLLMAGKRKEESLRKLLDKEKEEREKLRRENEGLKERIRCVGGAPRVADLSTVAGMLTLSGAFAM